MTEPLTPPPLIEARGIAKNFSGVPALRGVDFSVERGEIHVYAGLKTQYDRGLPLLGDRQHLFKVAHRPDRLFDGL